MVHTAQHLSISRKVALAVLMTAAFGSLAIVTFPPQANACGTTGCNPTPRCVLTITKSADKTTAAPGDLITYTVNFTNTGTADCTGGGVRVEDILPSGVTYVSETHSSNIDGGYGAYGICSGNVVRYNAHTLNPGESGWAKIVVRANDIAACGTAVSARNTAEITSYEYDNFSTWVMSNEVMTSITKACPPPAAPTADIKANNADGPITIAHNTAANLTWTSQNTTQCTVTPGNYTGTSGSHTTGNLTASQTYALSCTGAGGTATDSVTVNVEPPAQPAITADIKANGSDGPITLPYGSRATVSWTSQQASACTVMPGNYTGVNGSRLADALAADTTYTVTCTGAGGTATDSVLVKVTIAPVTADLKANGSDTPDPIPSGQAATLSWSSTGATACTVTPGSYSGTSGTRLTAALTQDTTYTLYCTGVGGTATDTVTVPVTQPIELSADIKANGSDGPVTIDYGTAATLTWTSTGAKNCSVTPGSFTGTTGEQTTGDLTANRTYTLSCTSADGKTKTDSVTVKVSAQNVPPTVTITADPAAITQGDTSRLTWTSQNAVSCTASGAWSGTKTTNGNQSVTPAATATYTITCANAAGDEATDSATVTVTAPAENPSVTLTANPTSITQGQNSVLTWTSQNTDSCTASGGWSGSKSLSGSETVYPSLTTTYVVTCVGTNGNTVQAQATVYVNTQQILPTVTLTANPSNVNAGQASVLTWTSQNANSCNASQGWSGGKSLSGSETVYPSITTTYRIDCVNGYGTASAYATVTVNPYQQYYPPQYPPYYPPQTSTNLVVTKLVANRTLGQTGFTNSVQAQALDRLDFEIHVRNNGSAASGPVTVRDLMPQELYYVAGSATVDGQAAPDGIVQAGIPIGTLGPFQERVIRVQATVFYGANQRTVTNQATAFTGSGYAQNGFATIELRDRGQVLGVADVVTGPEDVIPWMFAVGLAGSLLLQFTVFWKRDEDILNEPRLVPALAAAPAGAGQGTRRIAQKLAERLAEIRAHELRPDTA